MTSVSPSSSSSTLPSLTSTSSNSNIPAATPSPTLIPSIPSSQSFESVSVSPSSTFVPGGSGSQNNTNGSITTSATLYLYTFLATLVLLLSVSAAIVIRSFVLRRRHRLMVEEAIRNGTWVPPAPPTRPARVDLSKKPVLWEAYLDGKGDVVGYTPGGDNGKKINDSWRTEYSKEWDMIKPIAVAYLAPNAAPSTTAVPSPGLAPIPSVASLHSVVAQQGVPSASVNGPQGDVEATAGTTPASPAIAAATPPTSVRSRTPRHRAFLSRAIQILNPTPNPTSPLPGPLNRSNAGSNANLPGTNEEGNSSEMTELKGPKIMRVAVLIAMPSPPVGGLSNSTSSLSGSGLSGPSSSSSSPAPVKPDSLPTKSHPLQTPPKPSSSLDDDDEHPLPHLEVGVADVLVVPHDQAGDDHLGKKKAAQRGSLGSVASGSESSVV